MTQADKEQHLRQVMRHERLGVIPDPTILKFYKDIDPTLPVLIVQTIEAQLKREFQYASVGQFVAGIALVLMAGGFIFLVLRGHEGPAYALLGAGVLNIVGGFLRARLNHPAGGSKTTEAHGDSK